MKRSIVLGAALLVLVGACLGGFLWYRNSTGYWIGVLEDPAQAGRHEDAVEALSSRHDPGVEEALLKGAVDPDDGVRMQALQALRYRATAAAVEPLIAAIATEPASYRRVDIAHVLGQIGDGRAAPALIAALAKVENEYQANDIATEIGRLGASGVPDLIALLDDPSPATRIRASDALDFSISAIREKGEDSAVLAPAVDPLIRLLSDPESGVRCTAIDTLGSLLEPRAVEPLLALLGDPDSVVREVLARVLSYYGDPSLSGVTEAFRNGTPLVRIGAAEALAEFDLRATLGYAGDPDIVRRGAEAAAILDAAVQQNDLAAVGAYIYFIRHGRNDAVPLLVAGLAAFGDEKLANRFLNAGSPALHDAAEAWANANGYTVETSNQSNGQFQWGSAQ